MLSIIQVPDPSEVDRFPEMGLLLPVPGTERNTIVFEDRDGGKVQRLTASEVVFKVAGQTKFRDRKVRIDLYVTDARLAFACSNYDKGGGHSFFGGGAALLLDVGVNSASKIRARIQSRGKMLVGQVRYPWLRRIGSSPKAGFGTSEKLHLEAFVRGGGTTEVILYLPNSVSAAQVAAEVARRAARYRIATKSQDAATREALEEMALVEALTSATDVREVTWHSLPGADPVDEVSARLTPAPA